MSLMHAIIDRAFANPSAFNAVRRVLEDDFKGEKSIIQQVISKQWSVLDGGCGTGEFSTLFQKAKYTGIDSSERFIEYAKRKHEKEFVRADAARLPFKNERFDAGLIIGVLHHFPDRKAREVLKEVKRVLKRKGVLLVMEDVPPWGFNPLGRIVHALDRGKFIRRKEAYAGLFHGFKLVKNADFQSGACTYTAFVLEKR